MEKIAEEVNLEVEASLQIGVAENVEVKVEAVAEYVKAGLCIRVCFLL